jgi:hypothetical protein
VALTASQRHAAELLRRCCEIGSQAEGSSMLLKGAEADLPIRRQHATVIGADDLIG